MKTLEYLRGISTEDCRKLRSRGIRHTNQLLHAAELAIDRDRLGRKTGISPGRLLEFANQSAMLEISGMERYIPVVRRLGIDSLKDLKRADPNALHARVVDAVGLAGAPSLSMVDYWIGQARTIDTVEEPGGIPPAQHESPALLRTPPAAARRIG